MGRCTLAAGFTKQEVVAPEQAQPTYAGPKARSDWVGKKSSDKIVPEKKISWES